MTSQQIDFNGEVWFFGKRGSALADDIRFKPHVNIALVAPEKDRYLSASSMAEIIEDRWKVARTLESILQGMLS